jgi:acyl-CoA dehydrogenase
MSARDAATPADVARAVGDFTRGAIVPREARLARDGRDARETLAALMRDARTAGLWGLFHPVSLGGRFVSLADYLPAAEQEGHSEYGPAVFGSRATLDLRMLDRHGCADVRARWLAPLARGDALGAYAMTEPDAPGSVPATLATRGVLRDGRWTIDGRKWFISRAADAAFVTVVARTDADAPLERALSLFVVPADAPGFSCVRELSVFGRAHGQCELRFDGVSVPPSHLLGAPGDGLALIRERLALGRTLNAAHWVGLAQRCYDLMCERVWSPRGMRAHLPDKQLVRMHVYDVHQAIAHARAQVRAAAVDAMAPGGAALAVNLAKLAASRALNAAADAALQIHGAEGVSDATPLASIFAFARATRILDGADEALVSSCGQQLLDAYRPRAEEDA